MFHQWLMNSHIIIPKEMNATALVPSNLAMETISEERKKVWLDSYMLPFFIRAHFLRGSFNSEQLKQYIGQELSTLDPRTKWEVESLHGNIMIHNASFIRRDIPASNGFIFIINKVLQPPIGNIPPSRPTLSKQLDQVPTFKMFKEALNNLGLIEEIESSEQKFTIFVPSNSAVLKFYNDSGVDELDNRTLKYHIILGEKLSPAELKSGIHKATLLGFSDWLMFYKRENQTFVHDVSLDGSFFETKNGIILGLSGVLHILKNHCDAKEITIKRVLLNFFS
ncbi:stabilin-1 isoform X1 [Pelobates cultripes]|uniref:Stabilin-1 isoform X1 n=1 Tax=Pelobates cultripes TaxID=61616 RepID=A0AAD1WM35_PELCU|nr:stabilin-1 isoform X1 [Pelobates cultripes]